MTTVRPDPTGDDWLEQQDALADQEAARCDTAALAAEEARRLDMVTGSRRHYEDH